MAINKEKKGEILGKLKDIVDSSKSIVFVNFHGLSVGDTTSMRRKLKEDGVGYFVSKKTLAKLALKDSKAKGDIPTLDGEFAMVYSNDDETAPARGVYDFQKKFKENLSILGGIFDGLFKSKEEMTEIATIPSLQVLKGMFVNVINSPIQGLVVALSEVAKKKEN